MNRNIRVDWGERFSHRGGINSVAQRPAWLKRTPHGGEWPKTCENAATKWRGTLRTLKATISGTHVTEVMGETQGWLVWDHAPSGVWEKVVTPPEGEVFRTDHPQRKRPRIRCSLQSPRWDQERCVEPS